MKKSLLATLVGLFTAAGAATATAQDDYAVTAKRQATLEEIIVTAQKREEKLIDVPISIDALGADELAARRIGSFQDLGLSVPSVAVADSGLLYRRIHIRGIGNGFGFSSSLVGVYLDEVSVSGNPAYMLDLRPYDLSRVEVLKGPQGTLYGDGSVGGTIRFITNEPQLDEFGVKANLSTSFTKGGEASHKTQAVVNAPVIEGKFGLRVVGTFDNPGGWIDQPAAGKEDFNSQHVTNIRVKSLWLPTEQLSVGATAIVHRNDGSTNKAEDDNGNFTQVLGLTTTPRVDDDYELYNLTLNYDFGAFEAVSSTSYLDTARDAWNSSVRLTLAPGVIFEGFEDVLIARNVLSQELRLNSTAEGRLKWTLGGFYRDRDIKQDYTLTTVFGLSPLTDNQTSESWAAFGNISLQLTDILEVGGGLRYFEDDRTLFDGVNTQSGKFDSLSPRVYAKVSLSDDVNVYGSAAKGFRSGGFNQFGAPPFDPETIWTYELGTKMVLAEGRVAADIAIFYSDYEDFQEASIPPPPAAFLQITQNAGKAEIKGVEAQFDWYPIEGLSLSFSGNYIDTEITELDAISAGHNIGDPLDYIPEYSISTSITRDFVVAGKPGFARIDYSKQGRSEYRNLNITPFVFSTSDIIEMLNFNMEVSVRDTVSLGIFAENLLNERGYIDATSSFELAARPRPRTIGMSLQLEF